MSVRLPSDVYSPDHIGIVLWELGQLISHLQDASTRAKVASATTQPNDIQMSSFLINVLHTAGVAENDVPALEKLQGELRLLRDKAPVAHLMLAALPSRTTKRELVEWFRSQLHTECLVTFSMRGDIGGGFVLRIGSKQYDFTYKARLLEDKHRLTEIFDGVRG